MPDDVKPGDRLRVKVKQALALKSRPREFTKEEIDYVTERIGKSNAIRAARGLDPLPMPEFKETP